MSKFCFNKLYIIQSLADVDYKSGDELEKRINSWAKKNGISIRPF